MIVGNSEIKDIRLGDEPVQRVFAGDDLVWERKNIKPMILEYTVSDGDSIRLPIEEVNEVEIDWGDGSSIERVIDKNILATKFYTCFANCSSLVSIPSGLFDHNASATTFEFCFRGCRSLSSIPSGLFNNNRSVTSFSSCFYSCSSLRGNTPCDSNGLELWQRAGNAGYPPAINSSNCFYGCTGLANYAVIPEEWK